MRLLDILSSLSAHPTSTVSVRAPKADAIVSKTFPELAADVRALQAELREAGIAPRQVVGLQAVAHYDFIVWDLALITMGAVPHVLPEGYSLAELHRARERYNLVAIASEQTGVLGSSSNGDRLERVRRLEVLAHDSARSDPDLLTHVYSSGTTGTVKGLAISRSGAERLAQEFIDAYHIDYHDRHLIFLPLSHFQQRVSIFACLAAGASVMLTPYTYVFQDLPRYAPTFLVGPPAFYENMLNVLVPPGREQEGRQRLLGVLGPNLRFMLTGMAPIRRSVLDAFAGYGVCLLEGYGITEVGLVAWNTPFDNVPGTVGRPLSTHRIELTDENEIVVNTEAPLCSGYFDADAAEAKATFAANDRIFTGDIGHFAGGRLVLDGRKKDIIVTSGGMKFHPTELERLLLECPRIRQAAVITDRHGGPVTAVVSVDQCTDRMTTESVARCIEDINGKVESHKRISKTVLTSTRFTIENELLTGTMKPNRRAIAQHFAAAKG